MKAIWNGVVIAESEDTVVVEGNHYFPEESIKREHFKSSDLKTTCAWKGVASYYDLDANGSQNPGAAWYYPDPKPMAKRVAARVAFWKGVEIMQ
ncbi:MAG: hypothetical protein ACI9W4_002258 [Rhodothermales bacterium]|jgi:uncharacterized protein (DUF427 family)